MIMKVKKRWREFRCPPSKKRRERKTEKSPRMKSLKCENCIATHRSCHLMSLLECLNELS